MQKIVINDCYGGFGLSGEALASYNRRTGKALSYDESRGIGRGDPALVEVVEEMAQKANGEEANLLIVEIPDGVEWQIEDYDGKEWVAEKHRIWP